MSRPLHVIQRRLSSRPDRSLDTTLTELSHVLQWRNKNRIPKGRGSPRSGQLLRQSTKCPQLQRPHPDCISAVTRHYSEPHESRSAIPHFANCCWMHRVLCEGRAPSTRWRCHIPQQNSNCSSVFPVKAAHNPPADGVTSLNNRTPTAVQCTRRTSTNVHSRNQLNCTQNLLTKLIKSKSRHNFINNLSSATRFGSVSWIHNCGMNCNCKGLPLWLRLDS